MRYFLIPYEVTMRGNGSLVKGIAAWSFDTFPNRRNLCKEIEESTANKFEVKPNMCTAVPLNVIEINASDYKTWCAENN